ncbi:MAG: DUF6362 family protein [Acetobacter sp.]|nr:DUF6362 family protein [Acetobacter sp.]
MTDEIIEKIKDDLETAAYVDRLLPAVRAPKYRCCMPDIVYTEQEMIFMDRKPLKIRPNQEQIALWECVVLDWLPLLTPDERKLLWKRANRIPWKLLCREFGISRQRLAILYDKALIKIQYGRKKCH